MKRHPPTHYQSSRPTQPTNTSHNSEVQYYTVLQVPHHRCYRSFLHTSAAVNHTLLPQTHLKSRVSSKPHLVLRILNTLGILSELKFFLPDVLLGPFTHRLTFARQAPWSLPPRASVRHLCQAQASSLLLLHRQVRPPPVMEDRTMPPSYTGRRNSNPESESTPPQPTIPVELE